MTVLRSNPAVIGLSSGIAPRQNALWGLPRALQRVALRLFVPVLAPVLRRLTGRLGFDLLQQRGLHLTEVHYFRPMPDTRALDATLWERESALVGLDLRLEAQLALLDEFARYRAEYEAFAAEPVQAGENCYYTDNGSYPGQDAAVLHCMIRHFKPRRIIEVGSGFSTLAAAGAIVANQHEDTSYECELTAIEPYPGEALRCGFPGLTRLIERRVQEVPLEFFQTLGENDILFLDSTHVLAIGSDVQYEYLDIIPRLRPGVLIHAHDVAWPGEYPREWIIDKKWFWHEQYLLQAFLAFNPCFEILYTGAYLNRKAPAQTAAFTSHRPGSSVWIRRVR